MSPLRLVGVSEIYRLTLGRAKGLQLEPTTKPAPFVVPKEEGTEKATFALIRDRARVARLSKHNTTNHRKLSHLMPCAGIDISWKALLTTVLALMRSRQSVLSHIRLVAFDTRLLLARAVLFSLQWLLRTQLTTDDRFTAATFWRCDYCLPVIVIAQAVTRSHTREPITPRRSERNIPLDLRKSEGVTA